MPHTIIVPWTHEGMRRTLELQVEKYRSLERAAPHGSAAHRAAKVTADETQEALDVLYNGKPAGALSRLAREA